MKLNLEGREMGLEVELIQGSNKLVLTGTGPEAVMRLSVRNPVNCRTTRTRGQPLACSSSVRQTAL